MSADFRRRARNRALQSLIADKTGIPTFEALEERRLLSGSPMPVEADAGSTFSSVLEVDRINTFEDQSRESIYDLDGDNTLSAGDVIHGFLRLDNRAVPSPIALGPQDLYLAVAIQVESRDSVPDPTTPGALLHLIEYGPVTNPVAVSLGLDFAGLFAAAGVSQPTAPAGSPEPVAMLFENVSLDLVTTSPGDIAGPAGVDMIDYVTTVLRADFDVSLAIDTADDDFWSALARGAFPGADPITDLSLLTTRQLNEGVFLSFDAGLSVIIDNVAAVDFREDGMPFPVTPTPDSLHDFTFTNGDNSGAADIGDAGENPFFFTISDELGNTYNAFGVTDNADVSTVPIVGEEPEPQARITITPDDVNAVGQPHVFTAVVEVDDGIAAGDGGDGVDGFRLATDTEVQDLTVTLVGNNGADPVISSPADPEEDDIVASGDNNFDVVFTSATTGLVTGSAVANVTINGQSIEVQTDGVGLNSDAAVKRFVDAYVVITPDDTNRIGDNHTFTATVFVDDGLLAAEGGDGVTGFREATNAEVDDLTVTLTSSNGAGAVISSPADPEEDDIVSSGDNNFDVIFTSLSGGVVTGGAMANVTIDGQAIQVQTDGLVDDLGTLDSRDAVKAFVDAKIVIDPDDTNRVGDPHTFTATYFVDDGDGVDDDGVMGFYDAYEGAAISIALNNSNGAVSVPAGPLAGVTDSDGQFSVTFTSLSGGVVTGVATASTTINGVDLTESTDGSETVVGSGVFNSNGAVKTFVDAKVVIEEDGVNQVGDPHTFTATYFVDDGDGVDDDGVMGFYDAFEGAAISIALNDAGGAVSVPAGPLAGVTDSSGQFAVTFTSATTGTTTGVATASTTIDGVDLQESTDGLETVIGSGVFNSDAALKEWVDEDPEIDIEKLVMVFTDADIEVWKTIEDQPTQDGDEGLSPGFWSTHSRFGPAPEKLWPATGEGDRGRRQCD